MKKNAHLHLVLSTKLLEILKKQASDNEISLAELCRRKLRENSRLDEIERLLETIVKKSDD